MCHRRVSHCEKRFEGRKKNYRQKAAAEEKVDDRKQWSLIADDVLWRCHNSETSEIVDDEKKNSNRPFDVMLTLLISAAHRVYGKTIQWAESRHDQPTYITHSILAEHAVWELEWDEDASENV